MTLPPSRFPTGSMLRAVHTRPHHPPISSGLTSTLLLAMAAPPSASLAAPPSSKLPWNSAAGTGTMPASTPPPPPPDASAPATNSARLAAPPASSPADAKSNRSVRFLASVLSCVMLPKVASCALGMRNEGPTDSPLSAAATAWPSSCASCGSIAEPPTAATEFKNGAASNDSSPGGSTSTALRLSGLASHCSVSFGRRPTLAASPSCAADASVSSSSTEAAPRCHPAAGGGSTASAGRIWNTALASITSMPSTSNSSTSFTMYLSPAVGRSEGFEHQTITKPHETKSIIVLWFKR